MVAWDRSTMAAARDEQLPRAVSDLVFRSCSHSLQFRTYPDFFHRGRVRRLSSYLLSCLSFCFDLCIFLLPKCVHFTISPLYSSPNCLLSEVVPPYLSFVAVVSARMRVARQVSNRSSELRFRGERLKQADLMRSC